MYYYIYDSFLRHKKYASLLSKIENRLTDLGINGRSGYLSLLTSLDELLREAIRRGAETMVAVGDIQTVNRVVEALANRYPQIILGIIPIGPDNQLANLLGIPPDLAACDVLAARKIEKINLGQINDDRFFISNVVVSAADVVLTCDRQYRIIPTNKNSQVIINNFYYQSFLNKPRNEQLQILVQGPYQQGIMSKLIKKNAEGVSLFTAKDIDVDNLTKKPTPLMVDGKTVATTPAVVKLISLKLKVIVGRNRAF